MEIALMITTTVTCLVCFVTGAMVGQRVSRGEKVTLPNPAKAYRKHKDAEEYRKQMEETEIMLQNIDIYDGTSIGQRDV